MSFGLGGINRFVALEPLSDDEGAVAGFVLVGAVEGTSAEGAVPSRDILNSSNAAEAPFSETFCTASGELGNDEIYFEDKNGVNVNVFNTLPPPSTFFTSLTTSILGSSALLNAKGLILSSIMVFFVKQYLYMR